jgi:hypothetical protein
MQKYKFRIVICFFIFIANLCWAETKSADFNNDGKVDFKDFSIMGYNWGLDNFNSVVDISGADQSSDGQLNFYDIYAFADDFLFFKYIMCSHKSNNEKLYIWQSYNGISWYLRGNNPVYENPDLPHIAPSPSYPNNLTNIVRDPSIMKYNDKYYVAYTTNNRTACHYCGNSFGVASSSDLEHWEKVIDVNLSSLGGVSYAWAPEWFIDDDDSIHVFVTPYAQGSFRVCEIHPLNTEMTEWSVPVIVTGNLPGRVIDPFVLKIDGIYYLWYKNDTLTMIEYATSSSLTSGYVVQESGDWAGWGSGKEGESLIKINENTWRIYFDYYVDHGIYYAESSDNFQTWTPKKFITSESFIPAHPTVIHFSE